MMHENDSLPMVGSWNWTKARAAERANPVELLVVQILDGIMDDYVRDEDACMGFDERRGLASDIIVYRKRLTEMVMADGFTSSGGGKL